MILKKFIKCGKNKYKVITDKDSFVLYEDVILKNNLILDKKITVEKLENILKDNLFYEVYDIALHRIESKLRSLEEMKRFLKQKNYEEDLIDKVIDKLKKLNLLNDSIYIKSFINDKINLTMDGPYKIKSSLLLNGLNESEIDKYLESIDVSVWKDKIIKLIEKRKKSNNKSKYNFVNNTKNYLFNMGYPDNLIFEGLSNIDIKSNIDKEYSIAFKKYSSKYNGKELNNKIYMYLYRKGYTIDEIKNILIQ